jgi:hypothetical protein
MKARPILFSGAMIRANLAGLKTQTRRVVKPQPEFLQVYEHKGAVVHDSSHRSWCWGGKAHGRYPDEWGPSLAAACPYGVPGDLLWVRECFSFNLYQEGCWYWADGNIAKHDCTKPKPSIHMPRWASRLTLEITEVRVERLQDISAADAYAEGILFTTEPTVQGGKKSGWGVDGIVQGRGPVEGYYLLWEHINGPGSWDANSWVWVIAYRLHKANVDQVLAERQAVAA